MPSLKIMDHTGHTTMPLDNATEIADAMATFNELVQTKGYTQVERAEKGGEAKVKLKGERVLNPTVEETLLIHPLVGG